MERPAPPLSTLSRADIAYTAGLIDGEGCVSIACRDGRFTVMVYVGSTDAEILRWLQDHWGGFLTGPFGRGPNQRPIGLWRSLQGTNAKPLLTRIRPHAKIKSAQIENALRMVRLIERNGRRTVTARYRAAQIELYWIQRKLNHTGTKPFVRDRDLTPQPRERMF